MAQQIEPIEIFGCENKGVFLKMYGQHPFGENKTLKAEIIDVFGNVLFTRILVYGTTEEVAKQLGLTLKTNNMVQTSIDWLIEKFELYYNGSMQFTYREIIEQSKEKHNEEIMDAFQAGKWDWSEHTNNGKPSMDPAEYYNETFR